MPVLVKGKIVGFDPKPDGQPQVLLTYSSQWQACSVEWVSPLQQVLYGEAHSVAFGPMRLKCRVVSAPRPILEEAAHNAFWSLSNSALRWVGRYIGLKIESGASTLTILELLLEKLAPALKGEALMNVLAGRMRPHTIFDDILCCEEAGDLGDEQDKDEFASAVQKMASERVLKNSFMKEWVAKRYSTRKKGSEGSSTSTGRKKTFKNIAGAEIKRYVFAKAGITKDIAMRICPHPVHIYEDDANSRWQVYWKGTGSRSRSWLMYGYFVAAKLVLHWAWSQVLAREGLPNSACPIEGLFSESDETGAQAGDTPPLVASASASSGSRNK